MGGGPGSASSPSMAAPRLGAEAGAQWRLPAGEAAGGGGRRRRGRMKGGMRGRREEKEEEGANMWRVEAVLKYFSWSIKGSHKYCQKFWINSVDHI